MCAASSPISATPTAWSCGAPASGRFDVTDADPERPVPLSEALGFLPEVALTEDAARRAAHGVRIDAPGDVSARQAGAVVRLTDADGLDRALPSRWTAARGSSRSWASEARLPGDAGDDARGRRGPPAPRGGGRVRRRPSGPPRGDLRQRHGADLRAPPAGRGAARGGAPAAHQPRRQGRADLRARGPRSWCSSGSTSGSRPRPPQEFIDHVLVERLRATHVSVGENFRFGHGAAGDTDMLGADPRFETRVVAPGRGRR